MEKISFTLRPMQISDVKNGMRLSTEEGWNQKEKDWKFIIENPNNICLVAEANNKVIGTTTAINYSNEIAWIGMVLVDKNYRGMGVSKLLLTDILEKLKSFKSIKLDATSAGREVYKKFGFKDEYPVIRMTCSSMKNFSFVDDKKFFVESIQSKDISTIAELDEIVFGANRISLFKYLLREYLHKAWMVKRDGNIVAFALGRDGNKYHHIGPVIAETIDDAKILIQRALQNLNGQAVVVDLLNDKEELINWLHAIGFVKQREFVRMFKKANPFPGEIDNYFLICGPEFG